MGTNNTIDIIAKGPIFQEREEDYPDPTTLPSPTQEARITEEVTLSELVPGKYVSTTARVVFLRAIEKQDSVSDKLNVMASIHNRKLIAVLSKGVERKGS